MMRPDSDQFCLLSWLSAQQLLRHCFSIGLMHGAECFNTSDVSVRCIVLNPIFRDDSDDCFDLGAS